MSEQERTNFLKMAVSRAPGKRQIKPSAAIFEVEAGAVDDDEDDEDFQESNDQSKASNEMSDEESSNISNFDEEETNSENNNHEDLISNNSEEEIVIINGEEEMPSTSEKKQIKSESLICSVCLNTKAITKGVEVIQCDRCGLAVHEICYAVEELNDVSSVTSSASTEPWFCEPCMFGLNEVPYCELCPNRLGAFKKANVNGSWVHLLCALYTQGISFGDTDHLTAVSWQEMDFRLFGRKACIACTSKLDAKTGVTVQCEAGLCKNFYHVTCAQKLGLLMDGDTEEYHYYHQNGQFHNDFNFLLCKRHNHSDLLKTKKEAYGNFVKQETKRMAFFSRFLLNSRQEAKRQKQYQNYFDRMKRFENFVTVSLTTNKKARMLHNNSFLLNMFMEKAELIGITQEMFENSFLTVSSEQIPAIPPSFSVAFIKYFENRDKIIIPEEEERLIKAKEEKVKNENLCQKLELNLKQAQDNYLCLKEQNIIIISLLDRFCNALSALNVSKKNFSTIATQILASNSKPTPKDLSTPCKRQTKKYKINKLNVKTENKTSIDSSINNQFCNSIEKPLSKTNNLNEISESNNILDSKSLKLSKNSYKRKSLTAEKNSIKIKKTRLSENYLELKKKDDHLASNSLQNCNSVEKDSTVNFLSSNNSETSNLLLKSPSKRPNILSHSKPSLINANLTVKLAKVSLPLQNETFEVNLSNKNQKKKTQKDDVSFSSSSLLSKKTTEDLHDKNQEQSSQSSTLLLLLKSHSENSSFLPQTLPSIFLNTCYTCSKSNNQEQLIYCDTCKHYYHMGCLDPPLTKMPAIRKNFAFQCSDCAFPSSSSDTDNKIDKKEKNFSSNILLNKRQKHFVTRSNSLSPDFNLLNSKKRSRKNLKKTSNNLTEMCDQFKKSKTLNKKFVDKNKNFVKKLSLKNSKKLSILKQNLNHKLTSNEITSTVSPLSSSPIFVKVNQTSFLENGKKDSDNLNESTATCFNKRSRKQSLNLTPSPSFSLNTLSSTPLIVKIDSISASLKTAYSQKFKESEQKYENNTDFIKSTSDEQNNEKLYNCFNERRKVAAILRHNYRVTSPNKPNKSDDEINKNLLLTPSTFSSSTTLSKEI